MRLTFRHKLCLFIMLLSLVLSICVILFSPNMVLTGHSIKNGVQAELFRSKYIMAAVGFGFSLAGSILWSALVYIITPKMQQHPQMRSYKVILFFIDMVCLLYSCSGVFSNVRILYLN